MSAVSEDTIPAEAECGLRRFTVTASDGSRISVQLMQEKPADDCQGEIHPVDTVRLSREVVTNQQVTHALLQIASVTVRYPMTKELPDLSERWEAAQ